MSKGGGRLDPNEHRPTFEVGGARVQSGPGQVHVKFHLHGPMCNLLRSSAPALQAGVRHGARCSQGSTFGLVVSQQVRCCVTVHAVPVIQDVPGNGGDNPEDVILIEFKHQS